jgi:Ca2+-binding RTX toxin-like protein
MVVLAAALGSAVGIPRPAAAGEVHVEGSAVIFKAGNNEVNNVVVNARGAAFDQSTGQFVQGFTVSDSPMPATPGPGCRAFTGAVVCDVATASFVALDLGDKSDTVSQQEGGEPGDAVPMRVKGGPGNDTLTGGSRADNLDGELGDDTIDGGNGNDVLVGGAGIDTITGGDGTDTISAGLGKDTINARDGQQDTINCGLGHDLLTADASDTKKRCN